MKKLILVLAAVFLLLFSVTANAYVSVKGHYRSNGTYVAPYIRSSPDSNPYNNYSYPGNINPFTGKTATGNSSTYLNNYFTSLYGLTNLLNSKNTTPIVAKTKDEIQAENENFILNQKKLPYISVCDNQEVHIKIHSLAIQNAYTIAHIMSHYKLIPKQKELFDKWGKSVCANY